MTAVNPRTQYGSIKLNKNLVVNFKEKPFLSENLISGGFFVFKSKIFSLLKDDNTILEEPLETLVKQNNYMHTLIKVFGIQWII